MATVASLFGSQVEATEAMDALATSPFQDVETQVFEPLLDNDGRPVAGGNAIDEVATASLFGDDAFGDLSEDERNFYVHGVRSGGTVVVADVDDDRAAGLAAFFAEHGGRTAKND